MNLLKNLRQFILLTFDMRSANLESGALHKKVQKMMQPIVQASTQYNDGSITTHMHKKMQWYMVEMLWMSIQFGKLYRIKLDQATQQTTAFLGALGAISDILIDDSPEQDIARAKEFIYAPFEHTSKTPFEKLYRAYFEALEQCLPADNKKQVLKYYWLCIDAQFASRQQFQPDLPQPQLIQILKDKCGYTTILCRAVLPQSIDKPEQKMIYELGALVQFINDVNDLHKDSKQGIRNFANSYNTLPEMKQAIQNQAEVAFGLFKQIDYPKKAARKFLFIFYSFVIVSFAQLRHYHLICGKHYMLERFLHISSEKAKIQPFLLHNLKFSVPKVLRFNFNKPF